MRKDLNKCKTNWYYNNVENISRFMVYGCDQHVSVLSCECALHQVTSVRVEEKYITEVLFFPHLRCVGMRDII